MFRKASYVSLSLLLALSLFLCAGCGDDDPGPATTGTIVINPEPNSIDAPWTLSGPNNFATTGDGDQTLNGMALGEYTLAWDEVANYVTPANDMQTLVADGLVTFNGAYAVEVGTIEIDQTPDVLEGAGWILSGPQNETGFGDMTLTDMLVGEYTLTWEEVAGWGAPDGETQTLADVTVTFNGTYRDFHVFADTADKLIVNFKRYYAEMNLERYRELLHENYLFIGQSDDGNYDLTTEYEIANKMFNQVAGDGGIQIQDITVDNMQPLAGRWETTDPGDPNFGGSLKRPYNVTISFIILDANTTYEAEGVVIFYVDSIEVEQSDGSTRVMYQLLGQVDQTLGGKATENHSWSGVKALFD